MRRNKSKHFGFTLVELMVSITVASISMAGVISVFSNSVKSNADSLSLIRLNQELRSVMDVMQRDIRRAGYWSAAVGANVINPFADPTAGVDTIVSVNNTNNCITFSYDINGLNAVDNTTNQGFKLVGNAVAMRQVSATCAASASTDWLEISDSGAVAITALTFNLQTDACINLTSSDRSCQVVPPAGDTRNAGVVGDDIETMFVVIITLAGNLVGDASVNDQLTETVAIRNTVIQQIQ